MSGPRTFGALIAHDGVTLVEYQTERVGIRVAEQWSDSGRSTSIDEALTRLTSLIARVSPGRARISVAIEQFGVVHHMMTLPPADDAVLEPIVKREIQRAFGINEPVVVYSRGATHERREPARADERTAPRQLFVAAAPRPTIDALQSLASSTLQVEIATVVPKAIHSLYEAAGASLEPTAVLVCMESGPCLCFFLDGRLELAIDPPIALEGDRPTIPMILDQVERGAVYFRQQFRGAAASRLLLAARPEEYEALAAALESRLGARVKPLFNGVKSPEAVVAMGAVLEGRHEAALDLFPHPPTIADRVSTALRGANAAVAIAATVAVLATAWSASQIAGLSSARRDNEKLRNALTSAAPTIEPMRHVAERRADILKQVSFVDAAANDRALVARVITSVSGAASEAITFDELRVVREQSGWSATLSGSARGASTAQAVYALDAFLRAVRSQPGVGTATLEDFSYGTPADSAHHGGGAVLLTFRMNFGIRRTEGAR